MALTRLFRSLSNPSTNPKTPAQLAVLSQICFFVILAASYFVWTWSDKLGTLHGDDMMYLLIAEHYSPWSAHSDVASFVENSSVFPPLFPFLLGIFGAGSHVLVAHVATTLFLVLAFLVFFFWVSSETKSTWYGIGAVAVLAIMPASYMHAPWILSEHLYLLLTLGCILAIAIYERSHEPKLLWIASLTIAAAMLTRTAGIALLAGFAIYLLLNRVRRRDSLIALALAIGPVLAWALFNVGRGHAGSEGYMSILIERYGSGESALDGLLQLLRQNMVAFYVSLAKNLGVSGATSVSFIPIACVFVLGSVYRTYLRKLDGIYVLLYCGVILLWPAPAEMLRFVYVLVPFFLFHGYTFLSAVSRHWLPQRIKILESVYIGTIAILALSAIALTATHYYTQPVPAELTAYRPTARWYGWFVWRDSSERVRDMLFAKKMSEGLTAAQTYIPEGECVYSVKNSYLHFFTRRVSKVPPPDSVNAVEFRDSLRRDGCNYFFFSHLVSAGVSPKRFYPLERVADDVQVLSEMWVENADERTLIGVVGKLK